MSPTPDSTLADLRQTIADLQRANAELQRRLDENNAERDEALEQQTATAEVLQVINSSPGDLAPVFDAVLDKATRFCDAAFGTLWTYDGERFKAVALQQVPEAYAEFLSKAPIRPVPFSGLGRVAAGESVAHFLDVAANEAYRGGDPGLEALLELGKARSTVAVPLRKDNAVLGAITAYRQEVRPFSDKQIALLQNFAAQAVIAMENARLITETREALEQQTATAEVLQVINSSPGDLTPVFDAILEKAHSLCGVTFGFLQLYDSGKLRAVALRGVPDSVAAVLRQPIEPTPGLPPARLLDGERTVQEADMAALVADGRGGPRAEAITENGVRTALFVPLRKDSNFLGCIAAFRKEVRPFSNNEITLLENFAAQAVIAIENARLITETREALEQQTATAEVLQVINSSPGDLTPVFETILEKAHTLCGAAFGGLLIYDGDRFKAVALHNVPPAFAEIARQPFPPTRNNPVQRLLEGAPLVHIADLKEIVDVDPDEPMPRAGVELGGIRTLLMVPLCKDKALLGIITAYRQEVRPFSEKQIALLQNFAAQAVIAMENARLITETREALQQQTATAEVLQIINSSPGNLAPVFDAMLDKAMSLCEAASGVLMTYDGEYLHAASWRGVPEGFYDYLRQPVRPAHGNTVYRLLQGEEVVHIADLREDADNWRGDAARRAMIDLGGARTLVIVPLRKDGKLVGTIRVYRQEVRPFTDKQIALLQNFAAQAVIAMENARLITETREALEQQTATAEVLQVINSSPGDLPLVFDAMLEKALSLCGANFGVMNTYDGEHFHHAADHGVPAAYAKFRRDRGPTVYGSGTTPARLVAGESLVHTVDLMATEPYEQGEPARRALVDLGGARSHLTAALRKGDILLGDISIYRQDVHPFTDKQAALLQSFAAQAVIAMENARLITETREALEQQTATAEVLQVINSSPGDLGPVFDAMLAKAMALCGIAHGSLQTYDGQQFRAVAVRGHPEPLAAVLRRGYRLSSGHPILRLLDGDRFVQIPDLTQVALELGAIVHIAVESGSRTLLCIPLRKDDALLGMIVGVRREVRPFSEKEIALLENFAAQAVIAMENARLLGELRQRTEEVAELNRGLEVRVAEQVDELGRVGRLKRFLAPQLAELIVSHGDEKILESHRREIVVVFCDLRGYTAFTETAEPEEVLDFLRQYHGALGPLVSQFEGTLDQFSGDGIMVFFNDPVPCPDPAERAVKMTLAMREAAGALIAEWRERGRDLGFGAGIAQGYATLGQIGFSERSGYTAIGTVCNVAARLCAEAKDGQILLSQLVNVALKGSVATEQLGPLALKGLSQPVAAYNVPLAASQPALRVIEGGSQSV